MGIYVDFSKGNGESTIVQHGNVGNHHENFLNFCKICDFFRVYLGAACLPLNVVENQTMVGRLCLLEIENAARHSWLAMSNQRSFKIESFRFPAFVPKKIEYICF
jgi:hypothetical protein